MTKPNMRPRLWWIDFYKSLAAQLILLHHFAWYGPLAENAARMGGRIQFGIEWLAAYGRYAVAVFIVVSGFLAAQKLPMRGLRPGEQPLCLIRDGYLRLVLPFAVALLFAIACTAFARQWLADEALGAPPRFGQLLAHLLLLHSLLGVESLSAGVWYVAIDFQLYAVLVLLLWLSRRLQEGNFASVPALVVLAAASLFWFNRDPRWDVTAVYFFGAYALGVLAGWASHSKHRPVLLLLIALLGGSALILDFRPRIAIALAVALTLGCSRLLPTRCEWRVVPYVGGTSYALFLVHFPVLMAVSAVFEHYWPGDPWAAILGLGAAWLLSMLAADQFHRYVELPLLRWQRQRLPCRSRHHAAASDASGNLVHQAY